MIYVLCCWLLQPARVNGHGKVRVGRRAFWTPSANRPACACPQPALPQPVQARTVRQTAASSLKAGRPKKAGARHHGFAGLVLLPYGLPYALLCEGRRGQKSRSPTSRAPDAYEVVKATNTGIAYISPCVQSRLSRECMHNCMHGVCFERTCRHRVRPRPIGHIVPAWRTCGHSPVATCCCASHAYFERVSWGAPMLYSGPRPLEP